MNFNISQLNCTAYNMQPSYRRKKLSRATISPLVCKRRAIYEMSSLIKKYKEV